MCVLIKQWTQRQINLLSFSYYSSCTPERLYWNTIYTETLSMGNIYSYILVLCMLLTTWKWYLVYTFRYYLGSFVTLRNFKYFLCEFYVAKIGNAGTMFHFNHLNSISLFCVFANLFSVLFKLVSLSETTWFKKKAKLI